MMCTQYKGVEKYLSASSLFPIIYLATEFLFECMRALINVFCC